MATVPQGIVGKPRFGPSDCLIAMLRLALQLQSITDSHSVYLCRLCVRQSDTDTRSTNSCNKAQHASDLSSACLTRCTNVARSI